MKRLLILLIVLLIVILGISWGAKKRNVVSPTENPVQPEVTERPITQEIPQSNSKDLVEPVSGLKDRITKKPFGIYVTPQNSPVQPERFTGFHSAIDIEYEDVAGDVPIYAVADGKVVLSRIASGYGGVFMLEVDLKGEKRTVLYGHIRPSTLPKVGQVVKQGDNLGLLGTGYSSETDNERKHLHFAIRVDNKLDIRGYVQMKSELAGWENPLDYFKN